MDLLARYLQAVKFWLPRGVQDDIAAELAEDLRSKAEEQEDALGRKLSEAEWEAMLKRRGRPIVVASSYLPQRSLIGPMLYPIYTFVLKLALLCSLLPTAIALIAMQHSGISIIGTLWTAGISTACAVTCIFALIERTFARNEKWLAEWDLKQLPPMRDSDHISRLTSVIELVFSVGFVAWGIVALFSWRALTPMGQTVLAGFLFMVAVSSSISAVNIWRPYWTRKRHIARAGVNAWGTIFFAVVFNSRPFVTLTGSPELTRIVNITASNTLVVVVLVCAVISVIEFRRAYGDRLALPSSSNAGI